LLSEVAAELISLAPQPGLGSREILGFHDFSVENSRFIAAGIEQCH
jgi:hypothetical protein